MITHSIEQVKKQMEKAAIQSGRSLDDIKLIAVTKTRTVDEMKEVQQEGLTEFGENRVQEVQNKYSQFDKGINWHLIGHLQRNKVKYIIDKVGLIHSVDSLRLAKAIHKEAKKQDLVVNVLIQVNVANEDTKFGLPVKDVIPFLKEIATFKNIKIQGLMTMAPYATDPEESRPYFRQLKKLSVDINNQRLDNVYMRELSMGMTNDYTVAIEEGATMIRVGTGIFGTRDYS